MIVRVDEVIVTELLSMNFESHAKRCAADELSQNLPTAVSHSAANLLKSSYLEQIVWPGDPRDRS